VIAAPPLRQMTTARRLPGRSHFRHPFRLHCRRASLDEAVARGYKRAMIRPFGIATRITGPAR